MALARPLRRGFPSFLIAYEPVSKTRLSLMTMLPLLPIVTSAAPASLLEPSSCSIAARSLFRTSTRRTAMLCSCVRRVPSWRLLSATMLFLVQDLVLGRAQRLFG